MKLKVGMRLYLEWIYQRGKGYHFLRKKLNFLFFMKKEGGKIDGKAVRARWHNSLLKNF